MSNPVYDDLAVGASLQDDFLRDFMSAVRVKSARLEIFLLACFVRTTSSP